MTKTAEAIRCRPGDRLEFDTFTSPSSKHREDQPESGAEQVRYTLIRCVCPPDIYARPPTRPASHFTPYDRTSFTLGQHLAHAERRTADSCHSGRHVSCGKLGSECRELAAYRRSQTHKGPETENGHRNPDCGKLIIKSANDYWISIRITGNPPQPIAQIDTTLFKAGLPARSDFVWYHHIPSSKLGPSSTIAIMMPLMASVHHRQRTSGVRDLASFVHVLCRPNGGICPGVPFCFELAPYIIHVFGQHALCSPIADVSLTSEHGIAQARQSPRSALLTVTSEGRVPASRKWSSPRSERDGEIHEPPPPAI